LCKSEFFDRVDVPRANGMLYQTPFYRCGGCSVMFVDPVRFMESRPRIRGDQFAPLRTGPAACQDDQVADPRE
jgi:hypothetical protein